jgi:hypothetical protein
MTNHGDTKALSILMQNTLKILRDSASPLAPPARAGEWLGN